jgi:hypothetical protein
MARSRLRLHIVTFQLCTIQYNDVRQISRLIHGMQVSKWKPKGVVKYSEMQPYTPPSPKTGVVNTSVWCVSQKASQRKNALWCATMQNAHTEGASEFWK